MQRGLWKKHLPVITTPQKQSPVCDRIIGEYISPEGLKGVLTTSYQVYDQMATVTYRAQADIHGMLLQVQNKRMKGPDIKFTLGFLVDLGTTVPHITDIPLMPASHICHF